MLEKVKELRQKTGAGMIDCKNAIKEAGGNVEKALEILRKKGLSAAAKKSTRSAKQGLIQGYIHTDGRIGVLVEINCETDFVARNEEFKKFAKDISMQIAAANPSFIKREDMPKEIIDKERDIIKAQLETKGDKKKPENVIEKIVEGKLEKFYQEQCLLDQPFIRDQNVKVKDLLVELIAKTGENISIRRFVRYQLGESS